MLLLWGGEPLTYAAHRAHLQPDNTMAPRGIAHGVPLVVHGWPEVNPIVISLGAVGVLNSYVPQAMTFMAYPRWRREVLCHRFQA